MKNIIKKCGYALAFPIAFGAYSHAQSIPLNADLESLAAKQSPDFNHIMIDANSNQSTDIPEANPSKDWTYPDENLGTKTYNLNMCLKDISATSEQDKFRLRYTYYNKKSKKTTFYVLDRFPGTPTPVDPHMEGGFTMKMSTEATSSYGSSYPQEPLKYYNVKVRDNSRRIERTYEFFASDLYDRDGKKNCLDLRINLKDEIVDDN